MTGRRLLVAFGAILLISSLTAVVTYHMQWTRYVEIAAKARSEFDEIANSPPGGIERNSWRNLVQCVQNNLVQASSPQQTSFEQLNLFLDDMRKERQSGNNFQSEESLKWLYARVQTTSESALRYSEKYRTTFEELLQAVFHQHQAVISRSTKMTVFSHSCRITQVPLSSAAAKYRPATYPTLS